MVQTRAPVTNPFLAIVAHDNKHEELLQMARCHRRLLAGFRLIATRSTGDLLRRDLGLEVACTATAAEGGDVQIAARVVGGTVDAVIFLRDPLTAHPAEPDIGALMKVCDVHGVPLATNRASAEILLQHLARRSRVDWSRISHPSVLSANRFPWDPSDGRIPTPERQ